MVPRKGRKKGMKSSFGGFLFGNACMLLAVIFWGINIPVTKALIPAWMTADGIAAVRLVGGCVLFWLASIFIRCEKIERHDYVRIIPGGMVGLFAFIYLFIVSLRYGSAIDISIIMTLPPIFVILMGVLFEHQRPSIMEYTGVGVSFIGAAVVILGGAKATAQAPAPLFGNMLAILSSICFAFYLVILEKPSHKYRPLSLLRWVYLFAALPALCLLPGMQDMPIVHSEKLAPWLEILFILFCPTFFAYFLVQPAIKNIGSELASLYQYLLPVVAAITAILMGMEKLQWAQVWAMVIIIAGMVLTNIGNKRRLAKSGNAA